MTMSIKQRKIEIEPWIKLDHNVYKTTLILNKKRQPFYVIKIQDGGDREFNAKTEDIQIRPSF